ncbi:hypothetical protein [Sphingobacterium bovisgrunnientis]|uniref:hypothetical protein n=1 Tax=Sphingobacterium bovisgrunnientis TaxID=1874697 RepID=UPI001357D4F5|nr:hypothetical protein [Sphingobacterium bovisgrunnientis]
MKKIKLKNLDLEGVAVLNASQMMEVLGGVSWTTTTTTSSVPVTYRGCSSAVPCDSAGGACEVSPGKEGSCVWSTPLDKCTCQ